MTDDGGRFAYDRALPLQLRVGKEVVRDASFASPRGGSVPALLVGPPSARAGAAPGVLLMHGGSGNRTEFLDDALELAGHGAMCLLITAGHAYQHSRAFSPHRAEAVGDEESDAAVGRGRAVGRPGVALKLGMLALRVQRPSSRAAKSASGPRALILRRARRAA